MTHPASQNAHRIRHFAPEPQHLFVRLLALASLVVVTGCSSTWSGGFPLQNPSRVQPPGTGSYARPASYYQNGQPNTSASNVGPSSFPVQNFPAQNYPVQPAGYSAAPPNGFNGLPAGSGTVTTASHMSGQVPTTSVNRYPSTNVPVAQDGMTADLQWQQ